MDHNKEATGEGRYEEQKSVAYFVIIVNSLGSSVIVVEIDIETGDYKFQVIRYNQCKNFAI